MQGQYQLYTDGGDNQHVKLASRQVRMGFVRKVYSILTAQLLLTVIVAAPLQTVSSQWLVSHLFLCQLSLGLTMAVACGIMCAPHLMRQFPTNYMVLFVFTLFEGILVGFVSAAYTAGSVVMCAAATVLIFMGLSVYAWKTTSDFTGMGPYLMGALLSLMAFGFVITIADMCGMHIPHSGLAYALIALVIFVFYIIFDTQMMIGEYNGHKNQFGVDDYVLAALTLYLDIINLFLQILRLMGDRK
jgi:FtsH-binding integral membrane protein